MAKRNRLAAVAAGAAAVALSAGCASGQGQEPATGEAWTAPRTPDGLPDLEGVWTNPTITPFERGEVFKYSRVAPPESVADRAFFTEEEAARYAALTAADREAWLGYTNRSLDAGTTLLSTRQTSLVIDPPDGRVPVKAWAEAARDGNRARQTEDYRFMSAWDRCVTRGVPGSMFPSGYNNAYRFVQTPGFVIILYEMIHDIRVIPVTGRPHVDGDIRQWMGDARGRWEDDTLVVETKNFHDRGMLATSTGSGRMKGIPVSEALQVVERFTRLSEDELRWEVTVDDPEVYEQPWTVSMPLTRDPDYVMFEYACHEGNRDVALLLRGARLDEPAGP